MKKLSPEELSYMRLLFQMDFGGMRKDLLDHIDAITAEHNAEANRLSEQCDELTKLTVLQAERIKMLEKQLEGKR